ncbi:hypothetical protein [Priestia flexa]|uniref:hypothetical protein n=1 Tax=Priestia flexa TaxID=86664 RepID=UPI0010FC19A0|nr:hypothetical protein [Priestia flexa]QCS52357.1 hypothetical protein FED53_06805 [Priestia flexa]
MVKESILKNIHKHEIKKFLKREGVEKVDARTNSHKPDDYTALKNVIEEELSKNKISRDNLNKFIMEHLSYLKLNTYYTYELTNFFCFEKITKNELQDFIELNSQLLVDRFILDLDFNDEFQLSSTSIKHENNEIKEVELLFYIGNITTRSKGLTNFFASVLIDVENQLIFIKFNTNFLEYYASDNLKVVHTLLNKLTDNVSLKPLKIKYKSFNESVPQKVIFKMFSELSLEAEDILNKNVPEDTDRIITQFLKNINLSNSKNEQDYIKQIKAVVYQDLSDNFQDSLFKNGWVFRFVFKEKDYTRASSRTTDYSPIYGSKVYWNLKELIFKGQKMNDGGFKWLLPDNSSPIMIKLKSKHDSIIIQYYRHPANIKFRKEKDNFVARKIKKYL